MNVEIWISALQHEPTDDAGGVRHLTPAEVHKRARKRLPSWLAWELGAPEDEERTAAIAAALDADPTLAAALTPHALDPNRIGIVLTDALRERVRTAAPA